MKDIQGPERHQIIIVRPDAATLQQSPKSLLKKCSVSTLNPEPCTQAAELRNQAVRQASACESRYFAKLLLRCCHAPFDVWAEAGRY